MQDSTVAFKSCIDAAIGLKTRLRDDVQFLDGLEQVVMSVVESLKRGGRVFFAGNGGSAADAQHLAAEFVSRLNFDRPGLAAQSLATDTSILTAISNDYGYESLFARQLQALAKGHDIFIGITTSGRSPNILAAFSECRRLNIRSVALCGAGGALEGQVDHLIRIPSTDTARIQECHILVGHMICAEVESRMFSGGSRP